MSPILTRMIGAGSAGSGFGFGRRRGSSSIGGFIVQINPAVSGQTTFNLNAENLILDGGSGTSYTLTVAPSSTESNGTIQVDAWGEATASSPAGYAGGFLSMTPSSTFAVRLNAGPGPGGSSSGSGISPRGGGYAGIFNNNTVNQANALLIAGGGGGGGSGTGGNDNETGSFFGSGGSKVANFGLGAFNNPQISYGGRGGSHSAGGAGGSGGGNSGSALQGGSGGNARSANNASGGGGGGGGYYGGGGGAGGDDSGGGTRTSASGGGGSSYVSPSVQRGQIHYYTSANQPLRENAGEKTSSQSTYRNSKIIIKKSSTLPNILNISYSGENSVSTDGDWRIVRWTSPGSLTVANASSNASSSIDFLCIGGGGGGAGGRAGGGGGAGEFKQGSVVVSNGTFTITVGTGGGSATQGGYTSISGLTNVDANGGGGGNGGSSPGSGGGGGHAGSGGPGGFQSGGSGYDGGNISNGVFLAGGGGGLDRTPNGTGRSAEPSPPLSGPSPYGPGRGGNGGDGITSDLFGVSGCAGGGGGAQGTPGRDSDGAGVGGSPGGGNGGRGRDGGGLDGTGGAATTFGSGGGGSGDPAPGGAGSGYPGVVYIRYRYQ